MAADIHVATDGGVAATHPDRGDGSWPVAPATKAELNTLRPNLFPVACWRMDDIRFDFDSSFIRPEAAEEFGELGGLVRAHPKAPMALFGHADPTGAEEYNKTLSGRRATAVYGLLIRNTELWESLYQNAFYGDNWATNSVATMLETLGYTQQGSQATKDFQKANGLEQTGSAGPQTRKKLFQQYMDALGGMLKLTPADFLARGADAHGKGDYQGCGEANAILRFSKAQDLEFQKPENKAARNASNAPNRRVVAFLFRPGSKVDPGKWPCPSVQAGPAACHKRFWSDSAKRMGVQAEQRKYEDSRDTFGCRFYDRIAGASPCEAPLARGKLRWLLDDSFSGFLCGIKVKATYESGAAEQLISDGSGYIELWRDLGDYADLEFETEWRKQSLRVFVVLGGVATAKGAWRRLVNLGFVPIPQPDGVPPNDDALKSAVAEFQGAHGIPPTCDLDAATQAALGDAHEATVARKDVPVKPLSDPIAPLVPTLPKDEVS